MARRNKDEGPKPYEIAVAAVLSLIVGVIGAAGYLAFTPLEEVNEMPDKEDRRIARIYYVPGEQGGRQHGTWEPKRQAIETGRSGTFELVEEELNQWAAATYRDDAITETGPLQITADTPNFRIENGLEINVNLEWSIFGASQRFRSLAVGNFEQRRGEYVFRPDRVYVGSCPIPGAFGLARKMFDRVAGAYEVSPELREGWRQLASLEIAENEMKVAIP